MISQMKYNLQNGLYIDFFENGKVKSIAIAIDNYYADYIIYDEEGNISHKNFWSSDQDIDFIFNERYIYELRKKFNLLKIHEEIMREGLNFNYEKYFK